MDANRLLWGVIAGFLGFALGLAVEMRRSRKFQKQAIQARAAAEASSQNTTHLMEVMHPSEDMK